MRVVVTGGAGYLGTTLVPLLLRAGHEVTVVDRFFFGQQHLLDAVQGAPLRLVRDDVRWVDGSLLKGADALIDMAALSNDPAGEIDPWKTLDINYLGRTRMSRLAREAGVARYLLTSSCSIYGFQDGLLTEASPPKPMTVYARANLLAERDILPTSDEHFSPTAVRFATLFGPSARMRYDLAINGMVLGGVRTGRIPVMKDGTQWRPMLHVADAAAALVKLLETDVGAIRGEVFNVGSEEQNFQIRPLAEIVQRSMRVPPTLEWYGDPDHRSYRVGFAKAQRVFGYRPTHSVEEAVKAIESGLADGTLPAAPDTRTVEWYRHLLAADAGADGVRLRGVVF
jgi:nucleoside-diphosphate-sugar epimerase